MKLPKFLYNRLKNHNTSLSDNLAFPPEREYKFDYLIIKKRYNEVYDKLKAIPTNRQIKINTLFFIIVIFNNNRHFTIPT